MSRTPHPLPPRLVRRVTRDARERLLLAGLRLFAEQGFARTSTRELAEAAQVNVAAINYYFGDKKGLYRAAFVEPFDAYAPPTAVTSVQDPPLDAVVRQQVDELLLPLHGGERIRWCLQLHFREMVEPTGLWAEEIEHTIKPAHERLLRALHQHFGNPPWQADAPPDVELARLALAIAALGVYLHVGRDIIEALEPTLTPGPATADAWRETLVRHAWAMIDAEQLRRARAASRAPALPEASPTPPQDMAAPPTATATAAPPLAATAPTASAPVASVPPSTPPASTPLL